ncbi:ABC transporter permease [Niabella ginsenosidivorans]|uniref:ABC transporter permease n=1 Tax=Niabella ginsenosidivorans TaxID=1176587 RepID=A0A1A9I990_9BACT|nr:ABC transporter permease [Niabella ginsenosidivorans]ANH83272.1 ABC transporter permease [Niabella ginsenosidivorans]
MYKLWASIKKDGLILIRDKVGLALMFLMPIVLAIIIASVQNSTYELVNDKKVPLLLLNRDTGEASRELITSMEKGGVFALKKVPANASVDIIKKRMEDKEALLGMVIPSNYTQDVLAKAEHVSGEALKTIAIADSSSDAAKIKASAITLYYHPVLQKSFRQGIDGALNSVLQVVQSKYIVRALYSSINNEPEIPQSLEQQILTNETPVNQIPVSKDHTLPVPNATQHNIPAWTLFAMFFIVISLGSSLVREKTSGSFLRLKTMPTSLSISILSKQVTYVLITMLQAAVIFNLGRWLFPVIGLPALNIPSDKLGLLLVTFLCGWCATSFAICIGTFANTQEQSNGIGAISIVLFAAIGGLLVPAFAMPASFQGIMRISPLYWCLEAFYGLFLEGGGLRDIFQSLVPILIIIILLQLAAWLGMKKKGLI